MDRQTRVEALQRAYADFPNVQRMLAKLITVSFAELQETVELQLASLERATIDIDDWSTAKRAELEDCSQRLYDRLVRLETSVGNAVKNITVGRPN